MARLASIQTGGYFPIPGEVCKLIGKLVDTSRVFEGNDRSTGMFGNYVVLDPCAGTGDALVEITKAMFNHPPAKLSVTNRYGGKPRVQMSGIEMEFNRYKDLKDKLERIVIPNILATGTAYHSDAFQVAWEKGKQTHMEQGAAVLLLNPPYDTHRIYKREENRWLQRYSAALTPGDGVLLFVLPHNAISACADYLNRHYSVLDCYRFPEGFSELYDQVVIVGQRDNAMIDGDFKIDLQRKLDSWIADHDAIPTLVTEQMPSVSLPPSLQTGFLKMTMLDIDVELLHNELLSGQSGVLDLENSNRQNSRTHLTPNKEFGLDLNVSDMVGHPFKVAMPPKPTFIALAIAAGQLNGKVIKPDPDKKGWPDLLVKGRYSRELHAIDQKTNSDGDVTGTVVVQQAALSISVFDLTKFEYFDLKLEPDTLEPAAPGDTANMTVDDLLSNYKLSLANIMANQFPALHDAQNPEHQLELPTMGRRPFKAQAQLIMAQLKLWYLGLTPLFLGQVGTGKTTVSLDVAACMGPLYYKDILNQLKEMSRKGLLGEGNPKPHRNFKPVRNILVVCPPHLLSGWVEQVRLNIPSADVKIIENISDFKAKPKQLVDKEEGAGYGQTIWVLSREKAKLGSKLTPGAIEIGYETKGIKDKDYYCPKCGNSVSQVDDDEKVFKLESLVKNRKRCKHTEITHGNYASTAASQVASLLSKVLPDNEKVRNRASGRMVRYQLNRNQTSLELYHADMSEENFATAESKLAEKRMEIWQENEFNYTQACKIAIDLIKEALRLKTANGTVTAYEDRLIGCAMLLYTSDWTQYSFQRMYTAARRLWDLSEPKEAVKWGFNRLVRIRALQMGLLAGPTYAEKLKQHARVSACGMLHQSQEWQRFNNTLARLKIEQDKFQENKGRGLEFVEYYRPQDDSITDWPQIHFSTATGRMQHITRDAFAETGSYAGVLAALQNLAAVAHLKKGKECGEFLYQNQPVPRRYPIARYISNNLKGFFQVLLMDEFHEANNDGSAQERAYHRLAEMPGLMKSGLSGSFMGGYASSLFMNLWSLSNQFRSEFKRTDKQIFLERYGFQKLLIEVREDEATAKAKDYGAMSERIELRPDDIVKKMGEAPGLMPTLYYHYLLQCALIIHKDDLDDELPPQTETLDFFGFEKQDKELKEAYQSLEMDLIDRIKEDMFTPMAGKLWGAMSEMPSYLDLSSSICGNRLNEKGKRVYEIRYPADCGGELVTEAKLFPESYVNPKERWILNYLKEEMKNGRNVMLYIRHTGSIAKYTTAIHDTRKPEGGLVVRWQRLIKEYLGETAIFLDSEKVQPKVREAWINREIVGKKIRIMLVNPVAVQTGLNNLVWFNTAIWVEQTYSAIVKRQADGRLHRPGAQKDVSIAFPAYSGTAQEVAVKLLLRKVRASMELDGLDTTELDELTNDGTDKAFQRNLDSMSMGRAIYQVLANRKGK